MRKQLRFDAVPALLASQNAAIQLWTRRDLLDEEVHAESLWQLPQVEKILKHQLPSGAWRYPNAKLRLRDAEDYNQIETFRMLGELVAKYGLTKQDFRSMRFFLSFRAVLARNLQPIVEISHFVRNDKRKSCKEHRALGGAEEWLFTHQTAEGDFRGIYGTQYTPNYSAAIMELLIQAGYAKDAHIERGFEWLLSIRQHDGGWAIPCRTVGMKFEANTLRAPLMQPERSKPFSHLVTGIVLRAFAAHPQRRHSPEARVAGHLLASRLFKADVYPDRRAPEFWTAVGYPFWFTDLVSALDSLSWLGFPMDEPRIALALQWLRTRQKADGLWHLRWLRMAREPERDAWISLAICRIFKRFQTRHKAPRASVRVREREQAK